MGESVKNVRQATGLSCGILDNRNDQMRGSR